ncbi:hypothetical protein [Rhodococcus phage REQ1]|uniref:tail assembly chaperone n=1 Tax=Rhodococcus phage REQ1 TaxID=1109712 RepID=UPI00023EEC6E|nr:tail assembly chaperone [Rhodococcus phage REQ1]AEV52072.1 hypothetical protein [Rhodococcus phage REQ1]
MALLSKNDILSVDDRKTVRVSVPEWGGEVLVRTLSGRERDEFEASTVKTNKGKQEQNFENFRARFVALCVVDEKGERLFATRAEVSMLGNKSVAALQRVFNEAQKLNGMTEADVEELTESFEQDPDEASTSA